ncbi:MAG: UMP kinase, partial [Halobacteria archaeon]
MRVLIKIGGHLLGPGPDLEKVSAYANLLEKLQQMGHIIVAVIGGGENARKYINIARQLGAEEALCDQIGVEISRLNARLIIAKLGKHAYAEPPTNVHEFRQAFETGKIIVMGGLTPGHSTDAVAAIAAELIKADILIRATDVDGICTRDIKIDTAGKKLNRISPTQLLEMSLTGKCWAGEYELFDPLAVKIIERSKIP